MENLFVPTLLLAQKGYGRKMSILNLRNCPDICLLETKNIECFSQGSRTSERDLNTGLPNIREQCYHYVATFGSDWENPGTNLVCRHFKFDSGGCSRLSLYHSNLDLRYDSQIYSKPCNSFKAVILSCKIRKRHFLHASFDGFTAMTRVSWNRVV